MKAQSVRDRWPRWRPQTTIWLLVIVLLIGFGLRVYRLGDKSVWWDEGLAAWAARQSPADMAHWTAADVHPPLYFWLLHFWRWGSSDSEFGLRFLSAASGVLTIAATWLLGRRVGGTRAGLLAALLMSLSRFDVWWSQEMRMYVLAALLAALSLWAALRFWDRDRPTDGLFYVLFTVAGLYTLYLFASLLLVVNVAWLWAWWRARPRWRELARWGAAQAAVLILFAPWLVYALGRIPTWSSASPVALDVFLRIYWTVLVAGIPVNVESYGWLTIPLLVVFLAGLATLVWAARRNWRVGRDVALLLLGLLLPAAVVYAVSLPRETFFYSPQLAPRYLLIFAPAFYVLLAWGLARLTLLVRPEENNLPPALRGGLRGGKALLVIAVVGAAGYSLGSYYPGRILLDDYQALTTTLHAYQQPGDAVVLYTDADWPIWAYHHPGRWWGVPHAQPVTPEFAAAYLSPIWDESQGIWLVVTPYAGVNDPQEEIPAWLAARAVRIVEHRFVDKVLRFYARSPERAANAQQLLPEARPPRALEVEIASGLWLIGYGQPVRDYQSGDTIHLFLYWQRRGSSDSPLAGLEVSLVDGQAQAQKRIAAPAPDVLPGDTVRQQVDLVVPPDAPGGRYAFSLQALPGGETVRLGRVRLRQQSHAALTPADVSIAYPLRTDFADGVRLLGYDSKTPTLRPGDTLYLTLYWQARAPVEHRYKVFTHLLGEVFNAQNGNFLWGQQDNEPVNGSRMTSTWRVGEVVVDRYAILLDAQAPAGRYIVEIGLYDPATGDRLPVLDDQGQATADRVLLAELTVERDRD